MFVRGYFGLRQPMGSELCYQSRANFQDAGGVRYANAGAYPPVTQYVLRQTSCGKFPDFDSVGFYPLSAL